MREDESVAEDDGSFSLCLQFAAECCPGCAEPREPGLCPECGIEVGESPEVAEMAAARRKALEPLDARLRALLDHFDELPEGNIPLSNDQFATAVSDAGIFERIAEMAEIGSELGALDMNDRSVIGGKLRAKMSERVDRVAELLEACEELSLFDPAGPARELRVVAVESGRYGARLTQVFMAILVAQTIPSARAAETEMQGLLDGFPYTDRIGELVGEMEGWLAPDLDARAALVLGKTGRYSDEFGFLDIGAVFGAFAEEEKPMAALAACGRRYFSHLLGSGPVREEPLESFLVIPAIGLATLDRPLPAHRIARASHELLKEAATTSPDLTHRLVEQVIGEGELIFEAIEQIRRGIRLLAAGEEAGVADEGAILKTAMDAYKDLSETSFRTYGRLLVDLVRIRQGEPPATQEHPPTLGNLTDALAASTEPAAQMLASASDPGLRNACGHAQYRWEERTEEVFDMRTEERWSLEKLDAAFAAMAGAVAGVDSAYSCFVVGGMADIKAPMWAAGGAGSLPALVAKINFSVRGFDVVAVQDGGLTVTIEDDGEPDQLSLMSTLAGTTVFAEPGDAVRVLGSSGATLLDVEVSAFREASGATETFEDLAVLSPFLSNALRTGEDRRAALREWLTVMANQVMTTTPVETTAVTMLRAADRFGYVLAFARQQGIDSDGELSRLLKVVSRCRAHAFAAARGEPNGAANLAKEMLELNALITASGVAWPPT